jgi:hypothetical protein
MKQNILAFSSRKLNPSTSWILFLFLGWSYGSMNQMGKQILYYLTLGGFGLWTLYRLFTLNGKIDEYNYQLSVELGLTPEDRQMFGVKENPIKMTNTDLDEAVSQLREVYNGGDFTPMPESVKIVCWILCFIIIIWALWSNYP